ncbi:MAG: hypothetical protein BRD30_01700, partial [Bacteroidetes bacterium QH_2_63_10]
MSVGDFWQAPKREMGLMTERAALAILLAWALMYVWGLVEVGVVHPPLPTIVWLPVGGVCLAGLTYRGSLHAVEPDQKHEEPRTVRNPFRLGPSITFGGLYAALLVLPNGAQSYFGDVGVYLSRVGVGLADVDAITLLVAQLTQEGAIDSRTHASDRHCRRKHSVGRRHRSGYGHPGTASCDGPGRCHPRAGVRHRRHINLSESLFGGRSAACDFVDLAQKAFCTCPVVPLQGSFGHLFAAS